MHTRKLSRFMALTVLAMSACARTPVPSDRELIRPGDRLGDALITRSNGSDVVYVTQLHCGFDDSTSTETCEVPVGTKVNISQGFYDASPSSGETLDDIWAKQTHEMTVQDRPVDLLAFGSIDFYHPAAGTVRVWDVVAVADEPGTVTAHSSGVWAGEPWEYTAIIVFVAQ